jgi:RNA polymerase sigma factor (sigma-70 family)
MDEGSMLDRCRAGDQAAWRSLVDAHAGLVYAIGRAHRLPEDGCDDLAQVCFAALAANIDRIADVRAVPSWLRTTATRECWRMTRRMRAVARGTVDAADVGDDRAPEGVAELVERAEAHQRLRAALEELGGRCRDLLTALYLASDGSGYEHAMRVTGLPHGSIGPTRQRCLAKLARLLAGEGGGESGAGEA